MVDRAEAFYLFFKAVQGLEDVLDFVESVTDRWNDEVEYFRHEIDRTSEAMITMAVARDWHHAFAESGFRELWREYESFAEDHFRPYLSDLQ